MESWKLLIKHMFDEMNRMPGYTNPLVSDILWKRGNIGTPFEGTSTPIYQVFKNDINNKVRPITGMSKYYNDLGKIKVSVPKPHPDMIQRLGTYYENFPVETEYVKRYRDGIGKIINAFPNVTLGRIAEKLMESNIPKYTGKALNKIAVPLAILDGLSQPVGQGSDVVPQYPENNTLYGYINNY